MFPFFHSSSESPRPSETGTSLSEAVLDSASAYNLVPEKYHKHLDELRENIRAFCKEFGIPNEALKNVEVFGAALKSSVISQKRMAEAVSFFTQLEHLVTHGELFVEVSSEDLEYADRLYHITEQYNAQVALLEQVGILEGGAITGIDGKRYPLPTFARVVERLCDPERKILLETKHYQGFTKLLLVPFGMSLETLIERFKQFLLDYKKTHADFLLNMNSPVYVWEERYMEGADLGDAPQVVYFPEFFEKDHKGKTKTEVLKEQTTPGWRMLLLQAPGYDGALGFREAPQAGCETGQGEEFPRPDLKAGQECRAYLSIQREAQNDPLSSYFGESGMTPEDWIAAFMTHLQETGEPLDNYENGTDSVIYLTGAFFPKRSFHVPYVFWREDGRQVFLTGESLPGRGEKFVSSRFIVEI